jgi:hypothetical protein
LRNGRFSIYWTAATGERGDDPAQLEDLVDLEVAAVWDPEHVEDRLQDHSPAIPTNGLKRCAATGIRLALDHSKNFLAKSRRTLPQNSSEYRACPLIRTPLGITEGFPTSQSRH